MTDTVTGHGTEPGTGAARGLVRVSVVAGERRTDLALPAALPVAELLPEVARSLGVLDVRTVHGGYELLTAEGRRLSTDAGLTLQGVEDGAVLTLASGVDIAPPRVYDDVVEAMADAVEDDSRPWEPAASRRTALGAGVMLLGFGAVALALQRPDALAAGAAGIGALVLAAASVVMARVQREPAVAVTLGWLAVAYAATAGLTGTDQELLGLGVALGGTAAAVTGVVVLLGLESWRAAMIPAVAGGAVLALAGTVVGVSSLDPAAVHTVVLPLVVALASLFPWASLSVTGTQVEQAHTHADLTADPRPIDPDDVRRDMALGHQVLVAVIVTAGLLGVLIAPAAVSLGLSGTLLAVAAAVVMLLRTRHYRLGVEVATGLTCGIATLASVAVSILVLHPAWHAGLALLLGVAAAALLVAALNPLPASVRRGRAADVVELAALVAMLPLAVIATGLASAVQG